MSQLPVQHSTLTTVRGYELDSYGHVNNSVYLNYFEHGRWKMFRDLNLNHLIQENHLILVVTDVHIRYMREAKLYDEMEILTRGVREDPYLIFKQKLMNRQSGMALARAETKTIFLGENRRPVDIPKEFKSIFLPLKPDGQ
ncbi:MAG: acyl-CoA thioesterase [Bacteroidales bacterium]|nr:acyl-CoA thioesterase [Bacteroidales bacterium]